MGLVDNESISRRKMVLFFLIDKSGSMYGNKIGSVNDAIENVLPMIGEISDENPDAEINVAALEFSTRTRWLYDEPKDAKEFIWQKVEAQGMTSLGEACAELSRKLSRTDGFMTTPSGCYAPAIILLSDGGPTDNFEAGLNLLKQNQWYRNAIKIAIAIGDDADKDVLAAFTGTHEAVITVHNLDALKQMIRIVAITSSMIGSKSTTTDELKQEKVIKEVQQQAKDVKGADTADAATPADGDSYDDWD